NVIVGRLIPAGTGLAYHKARKRRQQEETEPSLADKPAVSMEGNAGLTITETEPAEGTSATK
ncbi:MAG: hypothetical protein HW411_302, partial [Gammaproteobacteria bacterium]|nr:hypothetical protein [Gammaproteobacteria bacterium]